LNAPLQARRRRGRERPVVDPRPIALVVGILLVILALFMIPPLVADLAIGHPDWKVFAMSGGITLFIGMSLILATYTPEPAELTVRQGFLLTTMVWFVTSVFAAIPFALSEFDLSLASAFFEAMSGLTTTGSTVMIGLDYAPPGLLLWRAILQWLGGVGIIVMGIAVLPLLSVGGMQLLHTESSDRSDKILPRATQIASVIGVIYLFLTIICGGLYWSAGMSVFEATAHAMTTIATGGYSTSDASIGFFQSARIEWTAILFMTLGGIPFVLYIQMLRGNSSSIWHDAQLRWFIGMIVVASALLVLWVKFNAGLTTHDAIRHVVFTTVSLITGTGYAAADYGTWGPFAIALLFFLMCVGGCTGSTTGGIKVFRFVVLYGIARVQMQRLIHPSGVFKATYNQRAVSDPIAIGVLAFVFLFAVTFSVIVVLLSATGVDYLTAMSAALTSLANVGPGLGDIIGPTGNFSAISEAGKWILSAGMLLGRLELFTVLVLFSPHFWRA
jgi:trk system potassium uptake protein TrkH